MSCTSKKNKSPESSTVIIQEAEQKIHQSQYDEAEADLKNLLQSEPKNARAKVVLASLYVHRAGVRIEDHIHLEEIINFKPSSTDTYIEPSFIKNFSDSTDKNLKQIGDVLNQLNSTLLQMKSWQEKLNQLPEINQQQADDLKLAIKIIQPLSLSTIKNDNSLPLVNQNEQVTEGMILYRSVIKIYLFKFLWKEDKFLPLFHRKVCQSPLENLKQGFKDLEFYVTDLLQDFSIGLPKEKENTLSQRNSFQKGLHQIQNWLSTVSPEAETLANILAEQLQNEENLCRF